MHQDNFEKRLQRQPVRKLPDAWRSEIINAAVHQQSPISETKRLILTWLAIPWRELIWPNRRIWAGLAAAWVVIVVVNLRDMREIQMASHEFTPPSPAVMLAWREQERALTDFSRPHELQDADRPKKPAPAPRSERQLFQG